MFHLRLFGSPDLVGPDGQRSLSVLSQHKRLALLAYLATATPRGFHSRDKLLALLWPESDVEHGRNSLRQALHFLRRGLGQDAIVGRGEAEIGLGEDAVVCDVADFERALDEGRPEVAVELYAADLLEGFYIPGAAPFEQWLDGERVRLRRRAVAGAWELAERARRTGDPELELASALRALAFDPSDEASTRRLIQLQGRLGNVAAAAQTYREFEERLEREYELKPSAETTAAFERVTHAEPPAPGPAGAAPEPAPAGLRAPIRPRGVLGAARRRPSLLKPRVDRRRWPFQRRGAFGLELGLGVVLVGLVATWGAGLTPLLSREPRGPEVKAIAVLPFRTIGPEEESRFVAEAMHQEILTELSRARALRVIALGSVADLRIDMEDNRAVAQKLGVDYLIRGALQADGDRIRIWTRLVEGATDEQLWASSLEGSRDDLFQIQLRVASEVAAVLEARFPPERSPVAIRPTQNPEAYEAYLKARLHSSRIVNRADARRAAAHLEEAVRLDPGFAPAWAALSYTKLLLAYAFAEHGEIERAEQALERAETLAPADVETWLAEAYFHSYASQEYPRALQRLTMILEARPSHAEAMALQGFVQRRLGLWEEAAASMEAALELDPASYSTAVVLAEMYMRMRRWRSAEALLDRAIAVSPGSELAYVQKALLYLNGYGDAASAEMLLRDVPLSPKNHGLPALVALYRDDYPGALSRLLRHAEEGEDTRSAEEMILIGLVYDVLGDRRAAAAWADSIRHHLEQGPTPDQLASAAGGVWPLTNAHITSAVAYALAGRSGDAVASAERAAEWLPLSRDAYAGTEVLERLAEVYALTGRTEEAVATLERLLSVPSRVTPHSIRMHPAFAGQREHPAFAAFLRRHPTGATPEMP